MTNNRNSKLLFLVLALAASLLQSCSGDTEKNGGDLLNHFCSSSATLVSGDLNVPNSPVSFSGLTISVYQGQGPYTLVLPDGVTRTTSTGTYVYPTTFSLTTLPLGGVLGEISVKDNASGKTVHCDLEMEGTVVNDLSIATSPSTSVLKGNSITLTASSNRLSPIFSFSHSASSSAAAITVSATANNNLTITSSVAQTVTVTARLLHHAGGSSTVIKEVVLTFTEPNVLPGVTLAASATTANIGTSILLTPTVVGISDPEYIYSQVSSTNGLVSISPNSNGTANISSGLVTTAVIRLLVRSIATPTKSANVQVTLNFTEITNVSLAASPGLSATTGTQITLTASVTGLTGVIYSFFWDNGDAGNNLGASTQIVGNKLYITSNVAGTTRIKVRAQGVSASGTLATITVYDTKTLTFTQSTNLTCSFSHQPGTYYRGNSIFFFITSSTGEQLRLTKWEPGEAWDGGAPTLPMVLPRSGPYSYFYANYSYTGTKTVRVRAESVNRPGVFCNANADMVDSVVIY